MQRHWRVYHSKLPAGPGVTIELSPGESHHVYRVLRLRAGDALTVFDGRGRECSGVIEGGGPDGVAVRLTAESDRLVEAPIEVVLFQGLCRPDRMEWVIQKATELGVTAVHAVSTQQADGRPPTPGRLERWRRIAIEACKQSGRCRVPDIEAIDRLPDPPAEPQPILLDGGEDSAPLGDLLEPPASPVVWIAVGPESGFTAAEVGRFREKGWRAAHLGPRTLRTETAGVVAATIVLHRWGDVGHPSDPAGRAEPGG